MTDIDKGHVSIRKNLVLVIAVVALVFSAAYLVTPMVSKVLGATTVTLEEGVNECMGVRTTPGSLNTTKQLLGGTLEPGGTATFLFTFPAETDGNPGQEEWKITDCVFINDEPQQKYTVTSLENDVSPVEIEFTLTIPADTEIGDEFCNYGKTTETPSDSQASNRKAGPACFIIGGALRVAKVDGAGAPLADATFTVSCDWPDVSDGTFLPDTILNVPSDGSIDGGGSSEAIDSIDNDSFSRTVVTGDEGVISVNGPVGTECTFTETAAPGGFEMPADVDCTLVVDTGEQGTCEFVNELVLESEPASEPASESASVPASGEQSVAELTFSAEESTADSAFFGAGSSPLPTIAFSLILLASLGALAYANVKTVRNRS